SGEYTRVLKQGLRVVFDNTGFHRRTVNRRGHTTYFVPDGSNRLSAIIIPPDASGLTYTFYYLGQANTLSRVDAPDTIATQVRQTIIATSGNRIQSILDPGVSAPVVFGYHASFPTWIISRRDRRNATT